MYAQIAPPGGWELILIVLIILLFFGAKKLPELARGSGRALRIFKAETKGLVEDDDPESTTTPEQRQIEARNAQAQAAADETAAREQRDTTT